MPASFAIGFEQVELVDGLSEDQPVWLYLRATLYGADDFQTPLDMHEIGSLPPDANRLSDPSYPKGDAGRYAAGLQVGVAVRNDAAFGSPRFQLPPILVEEGQTVELQVIMLPKVWFKEVEVPADELDTFAKGALLLLTAASYSGLITAGVAAVLGLFGGLGSDTALAPCLQTVITARHLFSYDDLKAIESEGMRRFGPRDNDLSPICGEIDSYYWLSVNNAPDWPSFGPVKPSTAGDCELRPHAHFPRKSWLEGRWSDSGDAAAACILITIRFDDQERATVFVTRGAPSEQNPGAVYENRAVDLAFPEPPFIRNVYDDDCPARSVRPSCPDCSRFTNLPFALRVDKQFIAMAALGARHVGARRLIAPDATSVSEAGEPLECCSRDRASRPSPRTRDLQPQRIGQALLGRELADGRLEIWPAGTRPMVPLDHRPSAIDPFFLDERHQFVAAFGAFRIHLNDAETLYSYAEFKNGKACYGRLRYIKTNSEAAVLADILLEPMGPVVK